MGYEIDFLPVGNGERSGDAITFRLGNLHGARDEQLVVVVDGGFAGSGEEVVKHITTYYGTDIIDLVVFTHPDDDHSCGLLPIIEQLTVLQLWIHRPWNHAVNIQNMFTNGRLTAAGLSEKFSRSLDAARSLEKLALQRNIPIVEPFTGVSHSNRVFVIGPDEDYYQDLLTEFACTPSATQSLATMINAILYPAVEAVKTKLEEKWDLETLDDNCTTRAENNSSVLLFVQASQTESWILTADAGIPALDRAMNTLERAGISPAASQFVEMPHHGSHHSVGPTMLDRLLGLRVPKDMKRKTAFVSASKTAPKHPSRRVANAFKRRGAVVHATQGQAKRHHHDAPGRANWVASTPLPFYDAVEAVDE